ncbi:hypothetical protein G6F56_007413 [Rhizopus delemar]|nr:hypothetical protein G6F56_007413 [Rhizopus delemar]
MSANNVLWNAAKWLENNYKDNNGLLRFFVAGDSSYQNRDRAMKDFVTIVTLAKSSDNPLYSQWVNAVSETEFQSVEEFWDALMDHENRQHSLNAYQKIKFINSDPSSQFKPSIAQKSKRKQKVDGVFVPGLSFPIGSFIGMNGILDMTDTTAGSQLSQLPEEAPQACQNRFVPVQKVVNLATIQKYEDLLLLNENDYGKFLKKSLNHIKYSHIHDQDDIVRDLYQYILKVHLYSPEVFTEKTRSFTAAQSVCSKMKNGTITYTPPVFS